MTQYPQGPLDPDSYSHAAPPVSFKEALLLGLKDWDFSRRGSRSEYWFLVLWAGIANIVLSIISIPLLRSGMSGLLTGPFSILFSLLMVKAQIRRYHDINKSGGWIALQYGLSTAGGLGLLIALVSGLVAQLNGGMRFHPNLGLVAVSLLLIVGSGIWSLVWCCLPGKPSANRWG